MRKRSTETNVLDQWPEFHLLRLRESVEHSRNATRKTLLILLIRRAIAIGVNLWLVLVLDKIVPSELAKFGRFEEEVQAVS